jgi:hypothetical protein
MVMRGRLRVKFTPRRAGEKNSLAKDSSAAGAHRWGRSCVQAPHSAWYPRAARDPRWPGLARRHRDRDAAAWWYPRQHASGHGPVVRCGGCVALAPGGPPGGF